MKKILTYLLALSVTLLAHGQINVQKAGGTNQISNGPVVVGNGNSISATGTGTITATNFSPGNQSANVVFAGPAAAPSAAPAFRALVDADIPSALTGKSYNGLTLTSTTGTFTLTAAKVFSVSNTLTLAGTDGSTLNVGTGGTLGSAAFTASTAYVPAYSGLTTNGLLQATGATAVASTLTPAGLTSLGVNSLTSAASTDLTLTGNGGASLTLGQGVSGAITLVPKSNVVRLHGSSGSFKTYNAAGDTAFAMFGNDGNGRAYVGSTGATDLDLLINSATAARLASTGNLLIGGTSDITGSGGLKVFGSTAASSTSSGALQVVGGAGIGGALYAGGLTQAPSLLLTGTATGLTNKVFSLQSSVAGPNPQAVQINPAITANGGSSSAEGFSIGGSFTNASGNTYPYFSSLTVNAFTLTATNPITDAYTLRIGGAPSGATNNYALYVNSGASRFGGATTITDATDASSTTTGSLQTAGGLGVAKKSYFGDVVTVSAVGNAARFDAVDTGGATITLNARLNSAGSPALQTQTNHSILFAPNNAAKMQLYPSGGLYLGVTPVDPGSGNLKMDGTLTVSGTGTSSFAGQTNFTKDAAAGWNVQPVTNTNAALGTFVNAGGTTYLGADNSTGANFGTAYATCLVAGTANSLILGTSGTARLTIGATTGAVSLSSTTASTSTSTGALVVSGGVGVAGKIFSGGGLNIPTGTPATSGATGTAGDIQWDASYIYVCTATNTWKRAALSTW